MKSENVTVIRGTTVALECALKPGSIPTPVIEWMQCKYCYGYDDTVVIEDTDSNNIRFLDGGRYLFFSITPTDLDIRYFCRVTNKEQFKTERAPYTYKLVAGESFI